MPEHCNPPGPKPLDQPWAYSHTDPQATWHFDLTPNNALPAMIVWLTITTNEETLDPGGIKPQFIKQLASATGLTLGCVEYIRKLATSNDAKNAFKMVATQFQKIGHPSIQPLGDYPSSSCPGIKEVIAIAQPSLSRMPE